MTKKAANYQSHFGVQPLPQIPPTYHVSGFQHPDLPVITAENPSKLKAIEWGLIPFFMKDHAMATALSNKTLNARAETIFEKPSFKLSAKTMRCAIVLDGFFEHHHLSKKQIIPYYIKMKGNQPFLVGGLYAHWEWNGIKKTTCSIITTKANALMAQIHNGGANSGRMPLILPNELLEDWLNIEVNDKASKDQIISMLQPYDQEMMEAYTVQKLRGKSSLGNVEEAIAYKDYI